MQFMLFFATLLAILHISGVDGESLVVCSQKEFHARCQDQEYIFIENAWYGRREGKCVKGGEKECGCDATSSLGDLCNGRTNCTTEVLDKHFPCENTCSKDYKRHVYVTYICTANSNTWIIIVGVICGIGFTLLAVVCHICRGHLNSNDLDDGNVMEHLVGTVPEERREAEKNPKTMPTQTVDNNSEQDTIKPSSQMDFELTIVHTCNGCNNCFEIKSTADGIVVSHSQLNKKDNNQKQTTLASDNKSESQTRKYHLPPIINNGQPVQPSAPHEELIQQDSKLEEQYAHEGTGAGISNSRQHSQSTVCDISQESPHYSLKCKLKVHQHIGDKELSQSN